MILIYLPYKDINKCPKVLTPLMIRKQISTARTILTALDNGYVGIESGIIIWREYKRFLKHYHNILVSEYQGRTGESLKKFKMKSLEIQSPSWWGLDILHLSHLVALHRYKLKCLTKAIKAKKENFDAVATIYYKEYKFLDKSLPKIKYKDYELKIWWPSKNI